MSLKYQNIPIIISQLKSCKEGGKNQIELEQMILSTQKHLAMDMFVVISLTGKHLQNPFIITETSVA